MKDLNLKTQQGSALMLKHSDVFPRYAEFTEAINDAKGKWKEHRRTEREYQIALDMYYAGIATGYQIARREAVK